MSGVAGAYHGSVRVTNSGTAERYVVRCFVVLQAGVSLLQVSGARAGVVYPGHWDSARVGESTFSSRVQWTTWGWTARVALGRVMGSCRHSIRTGKLGRQ